MEYIKSATVKQIINQTCLIIFFFFIHVNAFGSQVYVIQVAASKSPVYINEFSKKHNITDSITEIKSDDWYRYVVGNFNTLQEASLYSYKIEKENGIVGAFPRILKDTMLPHDIDSTSISIQDSGAEVKIMPSDTELAVMKNEKEIIPDTQKEKKVSKNNTTLRFILGDENYENIINNLINFGNTHLNNETRIRYLNFIDQIETYPIIVLSVFLIFLLILNVIFVVAVLYYSNQKKNYKERYIEVYNNMYESVLMSYLFNEIGWDRLIIKLKKIKKPLNREILTQLLINLKDNIREGEDKQISDIYLKIGLHNNALKNINSSSYYRKVKGMRELTTLYPEAVEKIVIERLNDPNDFVRSEAQISYIKLHKDEPFEFMRNLSKPYTIWTQLTAFHLFRLSATVIPSFNEYLNSEHPNVRNFCLRMITFFQQIENSSGIYNMLNSKMELSRFLSIKAINDLHLYEGSEKLKRIYNKETQKNKLEIIKAFKSIGDDNDFSFIEEIIRSGSISERVEAYNSMFYMSNKSREVLKQIDSEINKENNSYLLHVEEPRNS